MQDSARRALIVFVVCAGIFAVVLRTHGAGGFDGGNGEITPEIRAATLNLDSVAPQDRVWIQNAIATARIIGRFNGTNIHEAGSLVGPVPRPASSLRRVDLVAEYNAVNDPDLVPTVTWAPALFTNLHNAHAVPPRVTLQAGPAFSVSSMGFFVDGACRSVAAAAFGRSAAVGGNAELVTR